MLSLQRQTDRGGFFMLPYIILNVGEKEYKLRLPAAEAINLENKLGKNPLIALYVDHDNNILPKLIDVIFTLHFSLQKFHHGISLEDTYNIYDEYIDNGGTFGKLINALFNVLEVSGYFRKVDNGKNKEKN